MSDGLGDLPHGRRGYQILSTVVRGDPPGQFTLAVHLGIDRTVMTDLVEAALIDDLGEASPAPQPRRHSPNRS
ncbi:MAG: hypothetical protein ACYC1Z_06300 [Georgenia sp.]